MDAQDKGWEVKETAGGLVRVNKYTGDVAPLQMNGQAVQGKPPASAISGGKPMPASIIKNQQEEVEVVRGTEDINKTLLKYEKDIEEGRLNLGLTESAKATIANKTGYISSPNAVALNNFKSDIVKMVNASLRLNKGVQTEGDAQRTGKEILENINDPEYVRERLKTLQGYNDAAAKAKREVIDLTRAEYGKEPLFAQPEPPDDNIDDLLEMYK